MKKNKFHFLALLTFSLLATAGCGSKHKTGLGNTQQGQNGQNGQNPNNTPPNLQAYCATKAGSVYFPPPKSVCRYLLTSYAPDDKTFTGAAVVQPLYHLPEPGINSPTLFASLSGKRDTGVVDVLDANSRKLVLELGPTESGWSTVGGSDIEVQVMPNTKGVLIYVQVCMDENMHYVPCDF
jgi:hypothetical protein